MSRVRLILAISFATANAFGTGAGSCFSAEVGHGPAAPGDGGFSIALPRSVEPGALLTVGLHGSSTFRGFLLTTDSGELSDTGVSHVRWMNCGNGTFRRAITHSQAYDRSAPLMFMLHTPLVPQMWRVRSLVVVENSPEAATAIRSRVGAIGSSSRADIRTPGSTWYALRSRVVVAAKTVPLDTSLSLRWYWSRVPPPPAFAPAASAKGETPASMAVTFEVALKHRSWVAVSFGREQNDTSQHDIVLLSPFPWNDSNGSMGYATGVPNVRAYDCHSRCDRNNDSLPTRLVLDRISAIVEDHGTEPLTIEQPLHGTAARFTRLLMWPRVNNAGGSTARVTTSAPASPLRLRFWYGAANTPLGAHANVTSEAVANVETVLHLKPPNLQPVVEPPAPVAAARNPVVTGGNSEGFVDIGTGTGVSLRWHVDVATNAMDLELHVRDADSDGSWIALGFSRDGRMVGSLAVVAVVVGVGQVYDVRIESKQANGVRLEHSVLPSVSRRSTSRDADGTLALHFRHHFGVGEDLAWLQRNGIAKLVWAVGTGARRKSDAENMALTLGYHNLLRGAVEVDLQHGLTTTVATGRGFLLVLHITCMWLTFIVLLPGAVFAVFAARRQRVQASRAQKSQPSISLHPSSPTPQPQHAAAGVVLIHVADAGTSVDPRNCTNECGGISSGGDAHARCRSQHQPAQWFMWHRRLVSASLGICAVGFGSAIAVVDNNSSSHFFSVGGGEGARLHRSVGTVLVMLVALQTAVGVARPAKRPKPRRRMWLALHRTMGITIILLGMANVYGGCGLPEFAAEFAASAAKPTCRALLLASIIGWIILCRVAYTGALSTVQIGIARVVNAAWLALVTWLSCCAKAMRVSEATFVRGELWAADETTFTYRGKLYQRQRPAIIRTSDHVAVTIGRSSSCDICIADAVACVSSTHCTLHWDRHPNHTVVRDASKLGTLVNDQLIDAEIQLNSGDHIKLTSAKDAPHFIFKCSQHHSRPSGTSIVPSRVTVTDMSTDLSE